ncbi:MAG: hypothetical protein ACRCWR_00065, partial [Saezia sp.]
MMNEHKSSHLFLSMLKNPRLTGSLIPSSRYLAQLMARSAQGAEQIIELGAGTGPITKVLLKLYPKTPL